MSTSEPGDIVNDDVVAQNEDVAMTGSEVVEINDEEANAEESVMPVENEPVKQTFMDYLKSPIVELTIQSTSTSSDTAETATFFAHKALLSQSPYFSDQLSSITTPTPKLTLHQDIHALSSVLEYLYTGEYHPTILPRTGQLQPDPSFPSPDSSGSSLLRHARIYTLAKLLSLPALSSLAHRKIHLVDSTATGEIAYARYVYAHTSEDDTNVRKPVATFWATRSHVLRHEAEGEFRRMCLDFPVFGFDVLSIVLDNQEKRSQKTGGGSVADQGSARKRLRTSQG